MRFPTALVRRCWRAAAVIVAISVLAPGWTAANTHDPADGVWSQLIDAGPLGSGTGAYHYSVLDPLRRRMIIAIPFETWALSLEAPTAWSRVSTQAPHAAGAAAAIYDPSGDRVLVFGGDYTNELWELDLASTGAWQLVTTKGIAPSKRSYHIAVYDERRNRMIVAGGWTGSAPTYDVHALSLDANSFTWQALATSTGGPTLSLGIEGIYDSRRDRLVVFDGYNGGLWALDLANPVQWELLAGATSPGSPSGRGHGTAVYDAGLDRFVLFGGYSGGRLNETWAYSFSDPVGWRQLDPDGMPPAPTNLHTAIFDPDYHRMLVAGGLYSSPGVWSLDWIPLDGPPVIFSFQPVGGPPGTLVTIRGAPLTTTSEVRVGGAAATIVSTSMTEVRVVVPEDAVTGPISLTTDFGSAVSAQTFRIGQTPVVLRAVPSAAKVGREIRLEGRDLGLAETVIFTGALAVTPVFETDTSLRVIVPGAALTGPITVSGSTGFSTTPFDFTVVPFQWAATLMSVRDVPYDQGGKVLLRWEASDYDGPAGTQVTSYRVWRRAPLDGARQAVPAGLEDATANAFWELLGSTPAARLGGYAYTAPTFHDSLEADAGYVAFFVQAMTANAADFYPSNTDSGYSVDNLAPPVPLPFALTAETGAYRLHWTRSTAADFRSFRLYRGDVPEFEPSPTTLLAELRDTTYLDIRTGPTTYKLVAVDVHGNPSFAATVSPDAPVAALASSYRATGFGGVASLGWYVAASPGTTIEIHRTADGVTWSSIATPTLGASGTVELLDDDVEPGRRYGYRLAWWDGEERRTSDPTWVVIEAARVGILALVSNPGRLRDGVLVDLALAGGTPASLELFDAAGRRVAATEVPALAGGRQRVSLRSWEGTGQGVYFLRFTQGSLRQTRRVVLLE